jgi:ABC-2 type transport system ATP-binding protein
MADAGLVEKAHEQRVKEYSKGMRQKLGMAMAMTKDAPAVLLDEPTSGLTPEGDAEFLELLKRVKRQGKAILMSTHDIFRSKEIADRVGIMNEGKLEMQRTCEQLGHEDLRKLCLDHMEAGVTTA